MPSSSSDASESTGAINSFGRKTTMFISTRGLLSFQSSAFGLGCNALDKTFLLSSMHLSASSCYSSWRKRLTLLFWDLVKPFGNHCGLGFLCVWLDPSSSSCSVRQRSGSRHAISSSVIESAISSS
jgi:hypothetical protein